MCVMHYHTHFFVPRIVSFIWKILDVIYVYIYMYTAEDITSMSTMAAVLCTQLKGQANRWATGVNGRRSLTFLLLFR